MQRHRAFQLKINLKLYLIRRYEMLNKKALVFMVFLTLLAAIFISSVVAAEGNDQDRQSERQVREDRGGRGRFDPEAMQKRMADMMKERLEISDEEWKVVEPRLRKVMDLSRDVRFGGMGMFSRDGRMGGRRADSQQNSAEKAQQELRETLEKDTVAPELIKAKLTALREAREKLRLELITAQQELSEVLTLKQEAQLVLMGILE
jgi:predicted nucleic acid-binding Zn ribbon protein